MNKETNIEVKTPTECTEHQLQEFEDLLVEGGEVNTRGLSTRIRRAKTLFFLLTNDGSLIGIAALKNPDKAYKKRVFVKAKTEEDPKDFHYEVGWIYIKPTFRGQKLSQKLLEKVLEVAGSANVYATTRESNEPMQRTNRHYGLNPSGQPYCSEEGNYNLTLYTRRCL